MDNTESFQNAFIISIIVAVIIIPSMEAVMKMTFINSFIGAMMWLVFAALSVSLIISDAVNNLGSVASFVGWIIANIFVFKVTGEYVWAIMTIMVMIALFALKTKAFNY